MTVEADASAGLSLVASLNGLAANVGALCDRMDVSARFKQRANEAIRQVPLAKGMLISGGTGTLHLEPHGPPTGYYWSIRRFTAYGFTGGTAAAFVDVTDANPTVGEPVTAWAQSGINTFGKGEVLIHPNSNIIINAVGIIPTSGSYIYFWGSADQFETWLLPWYLGAQGGAS